jgi:hypothetical protein
MDGSTFGMFNAPARPGALAPPRQVRPGNLQTLCLALLLFAPLLGLGSTLVEPFGEWHQGVRFRHSLWSVAYGNRTYVAVGMDNYGNGIVVTSPDAVIWTERPAVLPHPLNSVTFGNGKFVAVGGPPFESGTTNVVAISTNGTSWTSTAISGSPTLNSVVFGDGLFVACNSRAVFASIDGEHWASTDYNSPKLGSPNIVNSLAFGQGKFVAIGYGTVSVSTNGTTWPAAKRIANDNLTAITYGNGVFLAVGDSARVIRSEDGESWTTQLLTADPFKIGDLRNVGFGNGTFIAVPWSDGLIYNSKDGRQWTSFTPSLSGTRNIGFGNGTIIALSDTGGIATSSDGRSWSTRRLGLRIRLQGIAFGDGIFVSAGMDLGLSSRLPAVLRSSDGTNWLRQTVEDKHHPLEHSLVDVAYGNGNFVAVGGSYAYSRSVMKVIYSSKDGVTWTQRLEQQSEPLNALVWGNGKFVIAGNGGHIMSSSDGISWELTRLPTTDDLVSVAHGNGTFVAVGGPRSRGNFFTSAIIYSSPDGVNWTKRDAGSGQMLQGVTFGNGTFVAVRWFGPYLTSTNAVTWTPHDLGGAPTVNSTVTYATMSSVHYINGWFLARDGSGTWISDDLAAWSRTAIPGEDIVQSQNTAVTVLGDQIWQAEVLNRPYRLSLSSLSFASESGADIGSFTVRRIGSLQSALPVTVSISGTAENGVDYDLIPTTILFPAGSDSVTIPVRARADAIQEGIETVILRLEPGEIYDISGNPSAQASIAESSHVPWFRPAGISRSPDGALILRVELPLKGTFEIEASSDLRIWQPIQTVEGRGDAVEIRDANALGHAQRFYRARVVP